MTDVTSLIRSHIDRAAAKAARKPSDGQKEAGNYRKGKIRLHGLDITIENPRGSIRSGVDKDGKPWNVRLPDHYGYLNRTEGSDGDHVDCYIGRHPMSSRVFVVDQVDADSGEHDEHKCLIGYETEEQAVSAYKRAFSDGRGADRIGSVEEMDIDEFKEWLHDNGDLPKYAAGGRVGYAAGGALDLPDAPWASPAATPTAPAPDLPDAPWATAQPAAAPAERTWGDTARSALSVAAPVLQAAGRAIPGPIGAVAAGTRNIDPALAGEAISNIPKSAAQFGSDLVQPILHPIDTAESFKNLGLGVLEKTGILPGTEHEKYADAVGRFLADRYGGVENVKRTFATDPVGLAGDVSMLLTGGGSAAARAPGMVGRVGEAARAAGTAIDPLRAVEAAGRGIGHVGAEALGVTTGTGALPLKVAQQAGFEGGPGAAAFRENLTGAAPLEAAVDEARGAVAQIRKERGDAYRAGMAKVGADDTPLDFGKIDKAVWDSQKVKTYKGQVLSPKTEGIRQEMTDAIGNWRDLDPSEFHTPEGIDALKQKLGDIRDATEVHTPARAAADQIYNAVRQTIVDQVPEYAKVMKGYETASKLLKEIETTLSLKPGANIDTSLRKLQSTLRDNVNTSFGRRTELADFLTRAGAPNLMKKLAGQALHAWVPRGLSRIAVTHAVPAIGAGLFGGAIPAALAAAATLPTMSPRLIGEAAYGVGKARKAYQHVAPVPRISRQIGEVARATEPFGDMNENPYRP
jgi:hypothetical protein